MQSNPIKNYESEIYRRKAAMVIYAIEISLTRLLINNNHLINRQTITFGEILQEITKISTPENDPKTFKELKQLAEALEIPSIRNACAHPVRDFHLYQWYRTACFAADPRIGKLFLDEVTEALACAEAGQISDPPTEWLDRIKIASLPNNIPTFEKYDQTGLIGRAKEIDALLNDLTSGRSNTFAIVGPGGVGKTSIAIDLARKISQDIGSKRKFDGIIYLTFKTNELTSQGVIEINKPTKSDDILNQFAKSLKSVYQISGLSNSEMIDLASNDALLVVLDNFEDPLTESQATCQMFFDSLPSNWKILATSRISVDGAKNIPIKGLTKPALEALARKYYESSTGRFITDDLLQNLTDSSNGNPLALKLMIDRIYLGQSISEAKTLTQNDVIDFSFNSLIQSLSDEQKNILECIFVLGSAEKISMLELTELSTDQLAEGLNTLTKTSLVELRTSDLSDVFEISSSVKDLLARSPLNLGIRSFYSKKISTIKIKEKSEEHSKIVDTFNFNANTPTILKTLGGKLPKLLAHQSLGLSAADQDYLRNFETQIDKYESTCRHLEDYYRLRACSRALLRDSESSLSFAKKALEIAPESFVSGQLYANLLISQNRNNEAREVLAPFVTTLLKKISAKEDLLLSYGKALIRDIFSSFFKTYIWESNHDTVITLTNNWKATPSFLIVIFALSRATALRRKHERSQINDIQRCIDILEAGRLIAYCLAEASTPINAVNREAAKIRNSLINRITTTPLDYQDSLIQISDVISRHLGHSLLDIKLETQENSLSNPSEENIYTNEIPKDTINAKIYALKSTYCFAHDDNDQQYFISFSAFIDENIPKRIGEKIKIWTIVPNSATSKTPKAEHAILTSK